MVLVSATVPIRVPQLHVFHYTLFILPIERRDQVEEEAIVNNPYNVGCVGFEH
jgi:hypothetical protein